MLRFGASYIRDFTVVLSWLTELWKIGHHHDCWCLGNAKSHGISSHGIDLFSMLDNMFVLNILNWRSQHNSIPDIDGLVEERHNSSALAMELRLSCINPSIYPGLLVRQDWELIFRYTFHRTNYFRRYISWNKIFLEIHFAKQDSGLVSLAMRNFVLSILSMFLNNYFITKLWPT